MVLAPLLIASLGTASADITDELYLSAGGFSATIVDNGVCSGSACGTITDDINPADGTLTILGSIDGWTVNVSGTSFSPGSYLFLNGSDLTLGSLADCNGGGCSAEPLTIEYSDIGFHEVDGLYGSVNDGVGTPGGTLSEGGYYDSSNTLFAETNFCCGASIGPPSLPFTGTNAGSLGSGPYSFTIAEVFDANGGTGPFHSEFQVDFATVPEPSAAILFGTVLAFCTLAKTTLFNSVKNACATILNFWLAFQCRG
ncbi:MAG: PEP-CTERM sorting domain-containing protein [Bryobacteraceae bacterium]|jgi:hypothetical protein